MAVQKDTNFEWSPKKLRVAEMLAEGTKTKEAIAKDCTIGHNTIYRWLREPEFLEKVDELTLKVERNTLAGMLRRVSEMQEKCTVGKTDWVRLEELKAKWLGLDKQTVEHSDQKIIIEVRRANPQVELPATVHLPSDSEERKAIRKSTME